MKYQHRDAIEDYIAGWMAKHVGDAMDASQSSTWHRGYKDCANNTMDAEALFDIDKREVEWE